MAESPGLEPRRATVADLPALSETMALAFYEDPVWGWAFPDPERRLAQHRAHWGLLLRAALPHGWVWLTGEADAATLWIPPGAPELSPAEEGEAEAQIHEMLGDGAARVLDTFARFDAAHPEGEPHYYLSLLGTHPEHRGRGLGMGLLAENLRLVDAEGMVAYLESTNPANEPRYERLGFRRVGSFELGEDGPDVTQMRREPGGPAAPAR